MKAPMTPFTLAREPRGRYATAHRELVARCPQLTDARALVSFGDQLQVDYRWADGLTPEARIQAVTEAAATLGADLQTSNIAGKTTTWFVTELGDVTVIVSAVVCECHDGQPMSR